MLVLRAVSAAIILVIAGRRCVSIVPDRRIGVVPFRVGGRLRHHQQRRMRRPYPFLAVPASCEGCEGVVVVPPRIRLHHGLPQRRYWGLQRFVYVDGVVGVFFVVIFDAGAVASGAVASDAVASDAVASGAVASDAVPTAHGGGVVIFPLVGDHHRPGTRVVPVEIVRPFVVEHRAIAAALPPHRRLAASVVVLIVAVVSDLGPCAVFGSVVRRLLGVRPKRRFVVPPRLRRLERLGARVVSVSHDLHGGRTFASFLSVLSQSTLLHD